MSLDRKQSASRTFVHFVFRGKKKRPSHMSATLIMALVGVGGSIRGLLKSEYSSVAQSCALRSILRIPHGMLNSFSVFQRCHHEKGEPVFVAFIPRPCRSLSLQSKNRLSVCQKSSFVLLEAFLAVIIHATHTWGVPSTVWVPRL